MESIPLRSAICSIKVMTILYLSHEDRPVLGSTLSLYNLIHSLGEGHRAIVILPGHGPAYDYFTARGVRCVVVPFHVDFVGSGYNWRYYLTFPIRYVRDRVDNGRAVRRIVRELCGERIDVVHTNTSVLDFGPALARRLGVPHVWHLREFIDLDMGFQPFLGWKRLRRMIHASDAVISITDAIARHFRVAALPQARVLHDAVRSQREACLIEPKERYFVFCGYLVPHKGPDVAVRAFRRFAQGHADYRLVLLGKFEDEAYRAALLAEAGEAAHCLDFRGYVDNVGEVISHATALLMCSANEALGRVTVEAMFYGCPVVGRNSGGTREIVRHGETGLLFEGDEECAEQMARLAESPELARRLAQNALRYACDTFSEETYGAHVRQIYQSLTR